MQPLMPDIKLLIVNMKKETRKEGKNLTSMTNAARASFTACPGALCFLVLPFCFSNLYKA